MTRSRMYLREGDVLISTGRGIGTCICIVVNDLDSKHHSLKRLIFKHPYNAYLGEMIPVMKDEEKISTWVDYGWECLLG